MRTAEHVHLSRLEEGRAYERFVAARLREHGIELGNLYQSKEGQRLKENALGMEIKLNTRLAQVGAVYVETAQKLRRENSGWIPSGIHALDRNWLYALGSYDELFIFGKKFLLRLHAMIESGQTWRGVNLITVNGTGTSSGFTISRERAMEWCELHVEFER